MSFLDRSRFQFDGDGYCIVYIDGSCLNNGLWNAKAGFGVYFGPDNPLNCAMPVSGRATNNAAEIQAAIQAILLATTHSIPRLCIRTDSDFLLNAVLEWISEWKRNGWHKVGGGLVENREDFQRLDAAINRFPGSIKWGKVAAHSGDFGNIAADRLAKEGAAKY